MMNDPYSAYIAAAYGITFAILGAVIVRSLLSLRALKRQIGDTDTDETTA